MVNEQLLKEFILSELASEQTAGELLSTDNLIESGRIDSLGIVQLIAYLEQTYSVEITEDDIVVDNFETIEAISILLRKKLG